MKLNFLISEVIFEIPTSSTAVLDSEKRRKDAMDVLKNISTEFPYSLFRNNFSNGIVNVWKLLQNPLLNKQLTYQLLDILILELYPSITQTKK